MRVLSLFSGGGLGDYGLELAGMEIVGQVEIDDYCQKILKLRWPDVPKWKDIKEFKGTEVEGVDLISGGFPCQDISVASKGKGICGSRSGLWDEFYRIIRTVHPRYVFVENTGRLNNKGLEVILSNLSQERYDAEWVTLRASDFYAPHERERLFLVAYSGSNDSRRIFDGKHEIPINENWTSTKNIRTWAGWKRWVVSLVENCYRIADTLITFGMDDGDSSRVDRFKMLGNGQVVQVVEWIGKRIMDYENSHATG